ncbi:hypothetical protein ACFU9B_40270 [Streptomyces sp. NPDC057592]|uniref:hypothetical protein n=1 Tax=unclassified Streptomyces TaxID=2593676 RepID=UPI00369F969E
MTRPADPRQMNGGWQMDLFAEPEPVITAGPARPALTDPTSPSNSGDEQEEDR